MQVLAHINRNFSVYNEAIGRAQTFGEFCSGFCELNEPLRQFYVSTKIASSVCERDFCASERFSRPIGALGAQRAAQSAHKTWLSDYDNVFALVYTSGKLISMFNAAAFRLLAVFFFA